MRQQYIHNRNNLLHVLPPRSSAILIAGNELVSRTADTAYTLRQDSNVLYLSGIQHPRIALLADIAKNLWWLVIPQSSVTEKIFNGAVNWDETAQQAGLDGCIEWSHAMAILHTKSTTGDVYLNVAGKQRQHGVFYNPYRSYIEAKLRRQKIITHDIQPYMARLRMIKQSYEIAAITQAVRITLSVMRSYIDSPQKMSMQSEQKIANTITAAFYTHNVMHAYDPIIASNANAATLHHSPDKTVIQPGSTVLFDVGAEYDGYAADISRTVHMGTQQEITQLVEAVTAAQHTLIQSIKPGGSWRSLHKLAIQELKIIAQNHRLLKDQATEQQELENITKRPSHNRTISACNWALFRARCT